MIFLNIDLESRLQCMAFSYNHNLGVDLLNSKILCDSVPTNTSKMSTYYSYPQFDKTLRPLLQYLSKINIKVTKFIREEIVPFCNSVT